MPCIGKLICLDGPSKGQEVILDRDLIRVGRAPDCDIVLNDKFASRLHAAITREENVFVVEDAGSKNGVMVNSQHLESGTRVPLANGTIVVFAQTRFRFEDPSATMTSLELSDPSESLLLHQATRQVIVVGQPLAPPLSLKQFELLLCLYERQGQAVSKDEIAAAVWPEDIGFVSDSNIDRLVSRVRQRLAEASGGHQFIVTVRGFGFRLECDLAEV